MKFKKIKNIVAVMICALTISTICPVGASAAWKQDSKGWWNTEGNSYSVGWRSINNTWYYFDSIGYMKTGWINDNGTWYYSDNSGAMKTGWINDNNTWYYADNSGNMKTGWINDNGVWYFTNASGAMQTGLVTVNNNTYYLSESGAMVTGNITINGVNHTFASTGEKITSANTNTNTITDESDTTSDSTGTGSSGGGGGGGGSSSNTSSNLSTSSSYSDLYGSWTIKNHISSQIETSLTQDIINLCINGSFTIMSDKITSFVATLNNPIVEENVLTSSGFADMFGDNFKNLGISGDKVKCITITDRENDRHSVDVLISDSGKVYAIVRGAVFALSRG